MVKSQSICSYEALTNTVRGSCNTCHILLDIGVSVSGSLRILLSRESGIFVVLNVNIAGR